MVFNWIIPVRIFQAVVSMAVLIAAGVFVSGDQDGAGEGAFMIFVPIFTFIALGYLVGAPLFFASIHNVWAVLGVEALTWVLWLSGFAALAAMIPRYICVDDGTKLCTRMASARAASVLGAFNWLAFCISLGLGIYELIQTQRNGGTNTTAGTNAYGAGIESGLHPVGPYDQGVTMQQPQYQQQQYYNQQDTHYPPQQPHSQGPSPVPY